MPRKNEFPSSEYSAEDNFRAAFERLKYDMPERVTKGTPVSQNNIAKEAGCDPSALRKSRYPALISEIQYWLTSNVPINSPSPRQKILQTRKRNRSLKEKLSEMKIQRDHANSLLVEANAKILDLSNENDMLRALLEKGNVTPLRKVESPTTR